MLNNQSTLETLIGINKDAMEFYESARDEVKSEQLKSTFGALEDLHGEVVLNLQTHARDLGHDDDADETVIGQMKEFWGMLMAKVSNDVDETLVTHLEEAEDRCLHSMHDAIKSDTVTPETKSILEKELSALNKSHDYVKALKESMKAA